MFGSIGSLAPILAVVLSVLGAKGLTYFVQEGSKGVKIRFGRVIRDKNDKVREIEPGFHFRIPIVYRVKSIYVRTRTLSFESQSIVLSDNLEVQLSSMLQFEICDVYSAMFEVDNLEDALNERCMGIIHREISKYESNQLKEMDNILTRLEEQIREAVKDWGVSVTYFGITSRNLPQETALVYSVEQLVKARHAAYKSLVHSGMDQVLATAITTGSSIVLGPDHAQSAFTRQESTASQNGHSVSH